MKDYDRAEKMIKKHIKKTPDVAPIMVDLGYLYELKGDQAKANEQYQKAIKSLRPDVNQYNNLANEFIDHGNVDLAIATYMQGREMMRGTYPFSFELAGRLRSMPPKSDLIMWGPSPRVPVISILPLLVLTSNVTDSALVIVMFPKSV